jgi:hypothetical protein
MNPIAQFQQLLSGVDPILRDTKVPSLAAPHAIRFDAFSATKYPAVYRQAPLSDETWEKLRQHPQFR